MNNILDEVIVHVEQRFKMMVKFRFVVKSEASSHLQKMFSNGCIFNFGCI